MSAALAARGLYRRFGGLLVTDDVSLTLEPGARHALIGPNGAGKTTLVNLLTGVLKPTEGAVILGGEDVTALPQHARVRRGLARTFQINQLFPEFSPAEALAAAIAEREGLGADALRGAGSREPIVAEIVELLDRFGLMPRHGPSDPHARLRQAAAARNRARARLPSESAAARRAGGGRAGERTARHPRRARRAAERGQRSC